MTGCEGGVAADDSQDRRRPPASGRSAPRARGSVSLAPKRLPAGQQAVGRLGRAMPASRSPAAGPAVGRTMSRKPAEAELHHQFEHRLFACGQPSAKLLVDQLEQERVGLRPGRGRGSAGSSPASTACARSSEPQNEWIVLIRAASSWRTRRSQ